MTALFRTVLEMSITGSWVILAVMAARLLLRRFPKRYSYALWAVAGFRLCCPVSFESVLSLFAVPNVQTGAVVTQTRLPQTYPVVAENTGTAASPMPISGHSAGTAVDWLAVLSWVWLAGMAAVLVYSLVCDIRLRLRLRTAIRLRENIWESEAVCSPFILGVVRPKIYLPVGLDPEAQAHVLAHEKNHLKHLDHLVKLLAFLILTVHWFNPLCHVAFRLMSRDMEMRCDEAVLRQKTDGKKYSATLVSVAAERKLPVPSPLAFGESSVKSRVKNILRWKQPKAWAAVLAITLCTAVVLACAADPAGDDGLADGKYIIANGQTGEDYDIGYLVEIRDSKLYLPRMTYDLSDKEWKTPPFEKLQWEGMLQYLEGAAPETLEGCEYMELFVLTDDTLDEYKQLVRDTTGETLPGTTMNGMVQTVFLLRQGSTLYVCEHTQSAPTSSALPYERFLSNRLAEPGGPLDPTVETFAQLDQQLTQILAQPGESTQEKAAADEALYWSVLRHRHIMEYLCHVMQTEGLEGEKGELAGILFQDVLARRFEEPLIERGSMTAAEYFESYMAYALEYYSEEELSLSWKNASGPMLAHLKMYYDYGK